MDKEYPKLAYYIAVDADAQSQLHRWRDSYLSARREWLKHTKQIGACRYHSKAFHRPDRFSFKRHPGDDWYPIKKTNGHWQYRPSYGTISYDRVYRLSDISDFDSVCRGLGFPIVIHFGRRNIHLKSHQSRLVWYPLWANAPDSDVVIRGPSLAEYRALPSSDANIPKGFEEISPEQAFWRTIKK